MTKKALTLMIFLMTIAYFYTLSKFGFTEIKFLTEISIKTLSGDYMGSWNQITNHDWKFTILFGIVNLCVFVSSLWLLKLKRKELLSNEYFVKFPQQSLIFGYLVSILMGFVIAVAFYYTPLVREFSVFIGVERFTVSLILGVIFTILNILWFYFLLRKLL